MTRDRRERVQLAGMLKKICRHELPRPLMEFMVMNACQNGTALLAYRAVRSPTTTFVHHLRQLPIDQ